ncbi:unnamed protein product [Mesocestoides corti]|nr:unnamed protein product [Mesocestoides corti]
MDDATIRNSEEDVIEDVIAKCPSLQADVSDDLIAKSLTNYGDRSSMAPQEPKCSCNCSALGIKNSCLQLRNLSCNPQESNPLGIPLNLEDGLCLIHRIACSKLDMRLRKTNSVDGSNTSSYALSLCCSQSGVTCFCTVDSCSCIVASSARLKASTSCQTDGLSDPRAIELFSSSDPFASPDRQLTNLDESSMLPDFSFINSFSQPSSSLTELVAPMLETSQPTSVITSLPVPPIEAPSPPPSSSFLFNCSFCGRIYRQKIHLRKHIMAQHTKQKPFFCPHCSYATVEKSHLTVHIRTHTGERPYTCRVCNYSSTQNCTLKSHYLRKHPESKITCVACGGAYVTELEYQNHLKNCMNSNGLL